MGLRPESTSRKTSSNIYGAAKGPNIYEKVFNNERSRLEFILCILCIISCTMFMPYGMCMYVCVYMYLFVFIYVFMYAGGFIINDWNVCKKWYWVNMYVIILTC